MWFDQATTRRSSADIGIAATVDGAFKLRPTDTIASVQAVPRTMCNVLASAVPAVGDAGDRSAPPASPIAVTSWVAVVVDCRKSVERFEMDPQVRVSCERREVGIRVEDLDDVAYGDGPDQAVDQLADGLTAQAARSVHCCGQLVVGG